MYGMCRHFEITVGFLGKKVKEIRGDMDMDVYVYGHRYVPCLSLLGREGGREVGS